MTEPLEHVIARVICPRYPLAIEGLDFGDGGERPLPGGFCCFPVDLPASLLRLGELRRDGWPYACADLERGAGHYIPGLTRLPPAMAIGAAGDAGLARRAGALSAAEARAAGVAMIFAPVLDVADEPANPIVAIRAYSNDPREVAALAIAWIEGCESEGVRAVGKHFPGHGSTRVDSHLSLPAVKRDLAQLRAVEEVPFRAAIARGLDGMMIGHLHVPAIDGETPRPTSLSRAAISGWLRGELGFRGLVVTDALDMGAIPDGATCADEPAVQAILAGADVAVLPRDPHRAARALRDAVASGVLPEARLRDAARNVERLVERAGASRLRGATLARHPGGDALAREIAEASLVREARGRPLPRFAGKALDVALVDDGKGQAAMPRLLAALRERGVDAAALGDPPRAGAAQAIAVFSDVRGSKGRVLLPDALQSDLVRRIERDPHAEVLSIGCPQALAALETSAPVSYVFDDDDASLRAAAALLAGALEPRGRRVFGRIGS